MNRIRLATPEEVQSIAKFSDLDEGCMVLALNTQNGVPLAVIRTAVEVDPVIYPDGLTTKMKTIFQRDIETVLQTQGVKKYYFNIHIDNKPALEVVETLGAKRTSTAPEYRFKVIL